MIDVYLDIDDNGYIISPDYKNIKDNVRLKIKRNCANLKIGDNFLANCKKIKELDISQLENITHIGYGFLSGCSGLKKIKLDKFNNLVEIGDNFMSNCYNLISISLESFKYAEKIGNNFLSSCVGLKKINLNGLVNIRDIGNGFLFNCNNIKEIRCSGDIRDIINIYFCENKIKIINNDFENLFDDKKLGINNDDMISI
jgi:hypothetical protein